MTQGETSGAQERAPTEAGAQVESIPHLVSGARPLKSPAAYERRLLNGTRDWIVNHVLPDAARQRPRDAPIDEWRTGRVLFVDGPRGAGKTSFLLTMLKEWRTDGPPAPATPQEEWRRRIPGFHVLFPILDFDPLPPNMPLHAWLLEPWRLFLKEKLTRSHDTDDPEDLQEKLANLAERAILGFTSIRPEEASAVAKALAYRDQASGLLDTQREWRRFVDAVVCRVHGCKKERCQECHPELFVVAIDDVDLQVEKIPFLLHAVRLLWHPNVLYILTGNTEHMSFILQLDYAGQHWRVNEALQHQNEATSRKDIERHSAMLRDALVEKVVARHATIRLRNLTSAEILLSKVELMPAPSGAPDRTLESCFVPDWQDIFKLVSNYEICTARQLEHVVDEFARTTNIQTPTPETSAKLASSLCDIRHGEARDPRTLPRLPKGRLETRLGDPTIDLEGDRLHLLLCGRPVLKFVPHGGREGLDGPPANRALLMQLAVEKKTLMKRDLSFVWQPVAGFIATRVEWDSNVPGVGDFAVFHWPWLTKPSAKQVLTLEKPATELGKTITDNSLSKLGPTTPLKWIEINLEWWDEQRADAGKPPRETPSVKVETESDTDYRKRTIVEGLRAIRNVEQEEVDRWLAELAVMTAPYVGLPKETAVFIRDVVVSVFDVRERMQRERTEEVFVKNALIEGRSESAPDPGSAAFASAAVAFIKSRDERAKGDPWLEWYSRRPESSNR
jgi:hypothetical protein